ncbi:amino acid transporter LysE [Pectobacterium araliae]|uniref:LysE family transporter n=1 Tax=Pectobacterium araliae TaxID=3073862 RepID=A0AAN0MJU5_9GAMM|nr:LysE family transporter [Pectobacterium sp. MAFF 302110]GKW20171.1 amino acid transporter LysE [Pectobacterium carotovorum subsp. carotovorum]
MDIKFIISALLVNLPLALSPGPTNILCLSIASVQGFKKTLKFIAGLQVLPFVYSLIIAIGAEEMLSKFESLSLLAKILGSIYMLYLAISMIRADSSVKKKENIKSGFVHGVFAQAINPKNIAIIITIYSLFSKQAEDYRYGIMLAIIITLCNMLSHLLWSYSSEIIIKNSGSFLNKNQDKIFGILLLIAIVFLWI